ncbi:hypothetical protein RJZ56_008194 [Blastomyces dermatitidis]
MEEVIGNGDAREMGKSGYAHGREEDSVAIIWLCPMRIANPQPERGRIQATRDSTQNGMGDDGDIDQQS